MILRVEEKKEKAMPNEEELIKEILEIFNQAQQQVLLASQLRNTHSQSATQFLYELMQQHLAILTKKCEKTNTLVGSLMRRELTNT